MSKRLNIGSHVSIAGGVDNAPMRGAEVGCEVIQIFVKSNRQWNAKPLKDDEIARFNENRKKTGIETVHAHNCYLINTGSADRELREKSERCFALELERCEALGVPWLISHPGSHTGSGEENGLRLIVESIKKLLKSAKGMKVGILVETTAGQGTNLGYHFEHLAQILNEVGEPERMGACFDTCHTFAAGYDIRTRSGCGEVFEEFDDVIGLDRLKAFHFNDTPGKLGEKKDRHAHIGEGSLGAEPFRFILKDKRFREIPKFLETPKGKTNDGRDCDEMNLARLRELAQS